MVTATLSQLEASQKPMKSPPSSISLAASATALFRMSSALQILAAKLPARTSTRQAMAFVTVAYLDAMGTPATLTQLREIAGVGVDKKPLLGQSIERTFDTFLEPTKRTPDALAWCYQEVDEDDRRNKYIRLTTKGKRAAQEILEALEA